MLVATVSTVGSTRDEVEPTLATVILWRAVRRIARWTHVEAVDRPGKHVTSVLEHAGKLTECPHVRD